MPENLIQGLQAEIIRVKEIITEYEHPSLKNSGAIGAYLMKVDVKNAELAIKNLDVAEMVMCFNSLKEYT